MLQCTYITAISIGIVGDADSQMLLTACDDMHSHLYDVEHASLIEAFSGARLPSVIAQSHPYIWPHFLSSCISSRI